jgi:hypothetical protein
VYVYVSMCACVCRRDGIDGDTIPWRDLLSVLSSVGEAFSGAELEDCLRALTGEPLDEFALLGKDVVGAQDVTQDLLGFEEV